MARNRQELPEPITASLLKRDREPGGGGGNPLGGCHNNTSFIIPGVRTPGRVHCACTLNYYLPASASPLLRPRRTGSRGPFAHHLIKVIPFLNKKACASEAGALRGVEGTVFLLVPFYFSHPTVCRCCGGFCVRSRGNSSGGRYMQY